MSAKANGGMIRGKVMRDVESPDEYKEAKKHAEALGLELVDVEVFGGWETHDGHPVFMRDSVDIDSIGRKYFHVYLDGESVKVQPTDGVRGPGKLRVTFKK